MWENYSATIIQNFYYKYIKCDRVTDKLCKIKLPRLIGKKVKNKTLMILAPLDPLYRVGYDEKYRFRLVEWNDKASIWHFNILSLIDWLNISKSWINPMTNCLFMNKSLDKIIDFISRNKIKRKLKLNIKYNEDEIGYKKALIPLTVNINDGSAYMELLISNIKTNDENTCYTLLSSNYDKIESDYFKINDYINEPIYLLNEAIFNVTALHLAVYYGNKTIVHHLLYFGSSVDIMIGLNCYTALHLAAILNYSGIGKLLVMYGSNIMDECYYDGKISTIFDICNIMGHDNFIKEILE